MLILQIIFKMINHIQRRKNMQFPLEVYLGMKDNYRGGYLFTLSQYYPGRAGLGGAGSLTTGEVESIEFSEGKVTIHTVWAVWCDAAEPEQWLACNDKAISFDAGAVPKINASPNDATVDANNNLLSLTKKTPEKEAEWLTVKQLAR
jgi:hypothetical protein